MPTVWHAPCASQARTIVERELADPGRNGLMPKPKFGKAGVPGVSLVRVLGDGGDDESAVMQVWVNTVRCVTKRRKMKPKDGRDGK